MNKDSKSETLSETGEQVIDWKAEAEAVIEDVGFGVKNIVISCVLPSSQTEIFLNIETKEGHILCVELSSYGFRVVSEHFDTLQEDYCDQTYYETPYALLNKYSPQFIQSFAAALEKKLKQLA